MKEMSDVESSNEQIIKRTSRQYYVQFSELGSYDSLEYWVDTLKEAEKLLATFEKENPKHFGFIAKPIKVVRAE